MSHHSMALLLVVLFTFLPEARVQEAKSPDDHKAWVVHMLQADTKRLLNFMSPMVDVDLPSQRGAFNHSQLQTVLTNFFKQYPPMTITFDQQGALNPRNDYFIGTYTSGDTEYRLYIQAERKPDGHKIFSFSIQRK